MLNSCTCMSMVSPRCVISRNVESYIVSGIPCRHWMSALSTSGSYAVINSRARSVNNSVGTSASGPDPLPQTRKIPSAAASAAATFAGSGTSGGGRYEDELMEISGTVISLMFINPHAMLAVEVEDENGNTVRWMAEFNNPPLMAREGWHKGTLKPGDGVTIIGRPIRQCRFRHPPSRRCPSRTCPR